MEYKLVYFIVVSIMEHTYTKSDDKQMIEEYSNIEKLLSYSDILKSDSLENFYKKRELNEMKKQYKNANVYKRIYGGHEATSCSYQVSFKFYQSEIDLFVHFCGGTIISEFCIATTAHCFVRSKWKGIYEMARQNIMAVAGFIFSLGNPDEGGQWRRLKKVHYHGKFDFPAFDVAVVHICEKFDLNNDVYSIDLENNEEYLGYCEVSGFGRVGPFGPQPTKLMVTEVNLMSYKLCDALMSPYAPDDDFICTKEGTIGPYKGDSGGAMMCKSGNRKIMYGIILGRYNHSFTVYVFTGKHLDFIKRCMNNSTILTQKSLLIFTSLISLTLLFML